MWSIYKKIHIMFSWGFLCVCDGIFQLQIQNASKMESFFFRYYIWLGIRSLIISFRTGDTNWTLKQNIKFGMRKWNKTNFLMKFPSRFCKSREAVGRKTTLNERYKFIWITFSVRLQLFWMEKYISENI